MLIVTLDNDTKYNKKLGRHLKRILPDAEYKAFTSASDCLDFMLKNDVTLIFMNQNIGDSFAGLQSLHHRLRTIRPHVDIIIVYNENESNDHIALWSIQSRCSDYICKADKNERLNDALQNIWFHPIANTAFSCGAI